MLRVLAFMACALVAVLILLADVHTSGTLAVPAPARTPDAGLDHFSTIVGFLVGIAVAWLSRVPWAQLPRLFVEAFLSWRSNVMLGGLAAACVLVLLLY